MQNALPTPPPLTNAELSVLAQGTEKAIGGISLSHLCSITENEAPLRYIVGFPGLKLCCCVAGRPGELVQLFSLVRNNDPHTSTFKADSFRLQLMEPNSTGPRFDEGASCCVYKDRLFCFGGACGSTGRLTNTVWCFNPASRYWKEVRTSNPPQPRAYHSAVVWRDYMVVFGGINRGTTARRRASVVAGGNSSFAACPFENIRAPDLWLLHFPSLTWHQRRLRTPNEDEIDSAPAPNPAPTRSACKDMICRGNSGGPATIPQGRDSHAAVLVNSTMYIQGGEQNRSNGHGDQVKSIGDLWAFSLDVNEARLLHDGTIDAAYSGADTNAVVNSTGAGGRTHRRRSSCGSTSSARAVASDRSDLLHRANHLAMQIECLPQAVLLAGGIGPDGSVLNTSWQLCLISHPDGSSSHTTPTAFTTKPATWITLPVTYTDINATGNTLEKALVSAFPLSHDLKGVYTLTSECIALLCTQRHVMVAATETSPMSTWVSAAMKQDAAVKYLTARVGLLQASLHESRAGLSSELIRRTVIEAQGLITKRVYCIVCVTSEVQCVFTPCGHMCMCQPCVDNLVSRSSDAAVGIAKCPMCRTSAQPIRVRFP